MAQATPTYVIAGASGAGKTTLIERLLALRPAHERWAILVNDFGVKTIAPAGDVHVREVVGCICCTAQVGLRTALVSLVRAARPDRVLVEASAAAEPRAVLAVLREPAIARALALRAVLAVASARQLADSRYADNAVYRAQLEAADVIAVSAESDEERRLARAVLRKITTSDKPTLDLESADLEAIESASA